MRPPALQAANAGLTYFAAVFAAGFVLGAIRVLLLAPALGEAMAVVLELPIMLTLSWFASQRIAEGFKIPPSRLSRGLMGGLAFGLLMAAELGVSMLLFGRTLAQHLEHYGDTSALLGLLGQLAFAAFPVIQVRSGSSASHDHGQ